MSELFEPIATTEVRGDIDADEKCVLQRTGRSARQGSADRREKTLSRVTDLFIFGSSHFSGDHIALFDGVFNHLIADIEVRPARLLRNGSRRSPTRRPGVIRKLAFDDAIEVARPVLMNPPSTSRAGRECENQKPDVLARDFPPNGTGRDGYRCAGRARRPRGRTQRGANAGARISETGYVRLVKRSEHDDEMAQSVGARPEIPRQHFLKLLTTASKAVRLALQAAHPKHAADVEHVVAEVASAIQAKAATTSRDYAAARALVKSLRERMASPRSRSKRSPAPASLRKRRSRLR